MKFAPGLVIFILLIFTQCSPVSKAAGTNNQALQQLVNSKNYTFIAQYAQPLSGSAILLTSEYTLRVNNDSLISYLPYFGRAYVAPVNPSDAGLQFTSTSFGYNAALTKRGGYTIIIKPKNEDKATQLILNISSGGYASLQVLSTGNQAISFKGIVK